MRISSQKNGFSLTEMVVVIAIVAMLTAIGLPAIRSLRKSIEEGSGTTSLIDAALSTARAIAAKEQRYAGVHFQLDTLGNQYMIFILHDPEKTKLSEGFRALEGIKPIKLPDDFRVIDMWVHETAADTPLNSGTLLQEIDVENLRSSNRFLRDTSCFSIIFSPAGKLVIHEVRVRNRDGIYQPANGQSNDDIFNSPESIQNRNTGMFIQDDYSGFGYQEEISRNAFYIYDKSIFNKLGSGLPQTRADDGVLRFNYFKSIKAVFINPYTGTIIISKK